MKESGEDRVLVPMRLNGLGSAQSAPEAMVILLSPVEEDRYRLPNGETMIYPIGVPPEMAPIYFAKITQHFMPEGSVPELSHFYELMSGTKLQTLHIYQGKLGARPYLIFKDKRGEENSFRVSLPNGILTALSHNLPILMEQKLLETMAAVVRINRGEPEKVPNNMEIIAKVIESGSKPEDPLPSDLGRMIGSLVEEERAKLIALAIEHENYEWAALLKELTKEDE